MMTAEQLKPAWRLAELLGDLAPVGAEENVLVSGLSQDSRTIEPGDLFIAAAGLRTHGLKHVDQAIRRGAAAVIWEPDGGRVPPRTDIPQIRVEELAQKLGLIAARFYLHPSRDMAVIGVTGTDGKTSVVHCLAQALHRDASPCGLIGTLGCGLAGELRETAHTTPDAITLQAELSHLRALSAGSVVMEASSHSLQQGRVNGVALKVAVLTHLSRDHLDYHGDLAAYARAKRRLFEMPGLDSAVLNLDDAFGRELLNALPPEVEVIGYGAGPLSDMRSRNRYVRANRISVEGQGLRIGVETEEAGGELRAPWLGRFNAYNLLAALAALRALDFPLAEAIERVAGTRPPPGRMQALGDALGGEDRPLVVIDYAHTPTALEQVLNALRAHCKGQLWCVFGCGGDRDKGKRPLMAKAAERLADGVIVTDDNPRSENPADIAADIERGFEHAANVAVIHDRAEAIRLAISYALPGDVVLIAGKGHERVQIVGSERRPFSDQEQALTALRGPRS